VRLVGILVAASPDDTDFQAWIGAFLQSLGALGWTIGDNVRIDTRWTRGTAAEIRRHVTELVTLAPDVILAHGASTVGPMLQATRTVPIVFPIVSDPVGAGFVDSLARPGGNATGFMSNEYSMAGKWLELLKEIAPGVTRAAILRDATQGSGTSQWPHPSECRLIPSICVTLVKSSVHSLRLRVPRTAGSSWQRVRPRPVIAI
jgi:ABC-type uncharacterized transport system substrate-binding protein